MYTYGYPSQVFSTSFMEVKEYARALLEWIRSEVLCGRHGSDSPRRSILFVCHNLGGIVCKQVREIYLPYLGNCLIDFYSGNRRLAVDCISLRCFTCSFNKGVYGL